MSKTSPFRRLKLIVKTIVIQGCHHVHASIKTQWMHLDVDTPLPHISIRLI